MVVRRTLPDGFQWLGPPYTAAEIRDLHRRLGDGPRVVMHIVKDRAPKTSGPASAATNPNKPETSRSAADAAVDPASPKDLP